MLNTTLTIGTTTFTKISEDRVNGSIYLKNDSDIAHPHVLTVKHDGPALGKAGTRRSLVSLQYPLSDADGNLTSERVTVNFTIARPVGGVSSSSIDQALNDAVILLGASATEKSSFLTQVQNLEQ